MLHNSIESDRSLIRNYFIVIFLLCVSFNFFKKKSSYLFLSARPIPENSAANIEFLALEYGHGFASRIWAHFCAYELLTLRRWLKTVLFLSLENGTVFMPGIRRAHSVFFTWSLIFFCIFINIFQNEFENEKWQNKQIEICRRIAQADC